MFTSIEPWHVSEILIDCFVRMPFQGGNIGEEWDTTRIIVGKLLGDLLDRLSLGVGIHIIEPAANPVERVECFVFHGVTIQCLWLDYNRVYTSFPASSVSVSNA